MMSSSRAAFSRRYQAALRKDLKPESGDGARVAERLGRAARSEGIEVLDLAGIHGKALGSIAESAGFSAADRKKLIARAGMFFANTIKPIAVTDLADRETTARLDELTRAQKKSARELATSHRRLEREVLRRRNAEGSLKTSKAHHADLIEQSRVMQRLLRDLSHRIITAQEAERKKISRELHDHIAQTLAGINLHLAALRQDASSHTKDLVKRIDNTQRIVEKSVSIVHRYARDLRPTILDDLGLVPALKSYVKDFSERTGIAVRFSPVDGTELLNDDKRTVMYRVAQAALTNVAQHGKAHNVSLSLEKSDFAISMEINDDGRGFDVERVLYAKRHKRLGVIGMRERIEMVRGQFSIESAPGKGTTIRARIPFRAGGGRHTPSPAAAGY